MQTYPKVNSSDRYLLCNYSFSDKMIKRIKSDVENFVVDSEKGDNYFKFINWQKQESEIVVLTMYAYDDISLPKKYNTVFDIDKPNNFASLSFTITQAIFNSWTPVHYITKGHKHICIIQFDKKIDSIFNSLCMFDGEEAIRNNIQLGICDLADFEAIKNKLQNRFS